MQGHLRHARGIMLRARTAVLQCLFCFVVFCFFVMPSVGFGMKITLKLTTLLHIKLFTFSRVLV